MAPQDDLKIGDVVEVVNMPDSSGMNGTFGTLVKTVGRGRWSIKTEGDDRSRVLNADNLQKKAMQPKKAPGHAAPRRYSIVGTWDDWEPNDMSWNADTECFEFRLIMGDNGTESFKFLMNEDWDKCVYPDRRDASPHTDHEVRGPDDGGLDEEWTIGLDSKDNTAEGTCYKVRMYVHPDGLPKRVTWEELRKDTGKPPAPPAAPPAGESEKMKSPVEEKAPAPHGMHVGFTGEPGPRRGGGGQRLGDDPGDKDAGDPHSGNLEVLHERAARERLVRRLEDAEQLMLPAIPDGKEDPDDPQKDQRALLMYSYELESSAHQYQIEANLDRYRAEVRQNTGAPRVEFVVRRPFGEPGTCIECGERTDNELGAFFCCKKCCQEVETARKEGWDPTIVCEGLTAARRVEELVADGSLSRPMARQYVMKKYPYYFQN